MQIYKVDTQDVLAYTVGMAQLVSAPDCGSGGPGFESLYPPLQVVPAELIGLSPSGKAQDFDSCITLVRIQLAQYGILAQSVEHLTFNQGVGGSNPPCLINENLAVAGKMNTSDKKKVPRNRYFFRDNI